ncbi:MAG: cysteine desulfurase [Gammaproteobacteria bacterium]|nr:cysteine desulfurase [Gammaproteobacteria bacterium]
MTSAAEPPNLSNFKDISSLRNDFPALHQNVNGKPLVYLDSAASAQRPQSVIDAMVTQDEQNHSNVHRGVHQLSQRSTEAYEGSREKVRAFINAQYHEEIVFTRGTTESINLVASSLGGKILTPDDEVLVTWMEHHSNIVPWQLACEKTGAKLRAVPINSNGELDLNEYTRLLTDKTKIVAVGHVSNALGTINPIEHIISTAHKVGALVVVDGAQSVPHIKIDVQAMDCDFYAFSGHKMYGPSGIGVLYGKKALLNDMPPYQGGGEMILTVSFERTTYNKLPCKFEAGTPNITGAVGLGATVDYLNSIDFDALSSYEADLLNYATEKFLELPGGRIIGTANKKASVLSFMLGDIHAHDLGTILDQDGIAIRTGHHCAMPVMDHFGIPATGRASFALYNNIEDIDRFILGLKESMELFK